MLEKALEESKELTCLGENNKKWKTCLVPTEKVVRKIDKNGKKLHHILKFKNYF